MKYIETKIANQRIRVWKKNSRLEIKSPRKWALNIPVAGLTPSLFVGKIEDPQDRWTLFHFIRANIMDTCPKCKGEVPLKELDGSECAYCRPCVLCEKTDVEKTYQTWGIYGSYGGYICGDCADYLLTKEQRKHKSMEVLC